MSADQKSQEDSEERTKKKVFRTLDESRDQDPLNDIFGVNRGLLEPLEAIGGLRRLDHALAIVKQHLDLDRVKGLAVTLFEIGRELSLIKSVIQSNPTLAKSYRSVTRNAVRRGTVQLEQLISELHKGGVFSLLNSIAEESTYVWRTIGPASVPEADEQLLNGLNLSEEERLVLRATFQVFLRGERLSMDALAVECVALLKRRHLAVVAPESAPADLLGLASGAGKVFAGVGTIALNAVGFAGTSGLIVGKEAVIASVLTGSSLFVTGARDIGVWSAERREQRIEDEPHYVQHK